MKQFSYHVIRTARDGINTLDEERRKQGISQMRISELAEAPDFRMFGSGDVKMSKYLRFLHATGFELVMVKKEDLDGTE